jgi:ABC-type multidrug transport system ATPase subunit
MLSRVVFVSVPFEKSGRKLVLSFCVYRCQETRVGGVFVPGVSGGERKRTSIGYELLVDPSLLFLDEPTSGLDSSTALRLLQVLQKNAKV